MTSKGKGVFSEEKNPRGIPKAPFIADVAVHLGGQEAEVEPTLKSFQEALAKYRYMEATLTQRRASLEDKIPDIRKTLETVEYLQEKRDGKEKQADDADDPLDEFAQESTSGPLKTTFELNDTLYAEAQLDYSDTVYLWLGANVMLSYKIPSAITLLRSKLEVAQTSLNNTVEDLEFLREQLTIMEVNTARVYNWDVKKRREKREQPEVAGGTAAGQKGIE